jgi:CDP-glycerol glycerophosphotransferase (TagB/SpsB family)
MKSATQVYKEYVSSTGTPFNTWISTEKYNFEVKKGVNADVNTVNFDTWLNKRYTAGGVNFWKKQMDAKINEFETNKSADAVVNTTDTTVPFLKRKMIANMTPVTLGLIAVGVITASIATIQIIRYAKRSKNK